MKLVIDSCHSFIHLSSSKRKLTIIVLHLSLSSATLFITPKFFKFFRFIISSVHVSLGLPLSLFPQTFPSKYIDANFRLIPSEHDLQIPFSFSACPSESVVQYAFSLVLHCWSLYLHNLPSTFFYGTKIQKHQFSFAQLYSRSNFHNHNLKPRTHNSLKSSTLFVLLYYFS